MAIREHGTSDQPERLTLSGAGRLVLASAQRLYVYSVAAPGQDTTDYDPVIVGTPVASRVSYVVPDGWQFQVMNRWVLNNAVRSTLKGGARVILDDYGPRTRIVLAGQPT